MVSFPSSAHYCWRPTEVTETHGPSAPYTSVRGSSGTGLTPSGSQHAVRQDRALVTIEIVTSQMEYLQVPVET